MNVTDLHVVLSSRHESVHAVNGMSFHVAAGETVAIVGESGCGKTTAALALLRLLPPNGRVIAGRALFAGRDLLSLSPQEVRRVRGDDIAMIFQDPMTSLNPVLSVGRQIAEVLETHRGMRKREAIRRAERLLERVGIPDASSRVGDYPHQFSGGMRQRVMVAIALACQPRLLIADEPTTALDVTVQAQILTLMRDLVVENGTALILITHDFGVVARMCERVIVMYAGTTVESGGSEEMLGNPRHPYTAALLQSVPRIDTTSVGALPAIPGAPPSLTRSPTSCPFLPRCGYAIDRCAEEMPPLIPVGPGHASACVRANEKMTFDDGPGR